MKDPTCEECSHFRQHYVDEGWKFTKTYFGHCVYPRIKNHVPDTLACVYFQKKEPQGCEKAKGTKKDKSLG